MAASLANDSANVGGICKNLIRVAELLYVQSDSIIDSLDDSNEENLVLID